MKRRLRYEKKKKQQTDRIDAYDDHMVWSGVVTYKIGNYSDTIDRILPWRQ